MPDRDPRIDWSQGDWLAETRRLEDELSEALAKLAPCPSCGSTDPAHRGVMEVAPGPDGGRAYGRCQNPVHSDPQQDRDEEDGLSGAAGESSELGDSPARGGPAESEARAEECTCPPTYPRFYKDGHWEGDPDCPVDHGLSEGASLSGFERRPPGRAAGSLAESVKSESVSAEGIAERLEARAEHSRSRANEEGCSAWLRTNELGRAGAFDEAASEIRNASLASKT